MRQRTWDILVCVALLAGCAAAGPAANGDAPADAGSTAGSAVRAEAPILIDRTDLRIGTTVHFGRIPSAPELLDVNTVPGLAHVVLAPDEWPVDFYPLQHLGMVPQEADVIVLLRGWPPTRAAAEAWNQVGSRLRIIMIVPGPPPTRTVIDDVNAMRALERVIADMDAPDRAGFERLQRPLSFRKVVD